MNNGEFMQLVTALRELDHHQRKRLSASLNQASDEAKVFDVIEACFECKSLVLIVPVPSCTALVVLAGCSVTVANSATRPSMP
ncbi:hypothetical protein MGMO_115c00160 [Methyloglobulus morosus KoM1]|uniref:Uncharacterized protein n=1 Tax=Methyloglobulus morosus KoM1 TaxID=1116472 RepID=V5DUZ7_9GAMM|nr:hypothetical protein MGMO_115c00160 [Methyloglobulus morosus KoM1]